MIIFYMIELCEYFFLVFQYLSRSTGQRNKVYFRFLQNNRFTQKKVLEHDARIYCSYYRFGCVGNLHRV